MSVLIAGCGDLGSQAGLLYHAAGHSVVGWRRRPENLPAEITGQAVDLSACVPPIPAETDILVFSASAGERTEAAYRAGYVNVVVNVLDALERDGVRPRKVLFVSSTAVYSASAGEVDEKTPVDPDTVTARVLLEAENVLHLRRPNAVVLRLSGIYGPGRTRLITQARSGNSIRLSAYPQFTNRIHRDDAAAAIVHLTTVVPDPEPLYLGTDDEPADLGDVLTFVAGELGLPPVGLERVAGAPAAAKRCSNRLLRDTGFDLAYPTFREGYRAVLTGKGRRHG